MVNWSSSFLLNTGRHLIVFLMNNDQYFARIPIASGGPFCRDFQKEVSQVFSLKIPNSSSAGFVHWWGNVLWHAIQPWTVQHPSDVYLVLREELTAFLEWRAVYTPGSYNHCHYIGTPSAQFCLPLSPTRQCCKTSFNQNAIDEDKLSQHYATLNKGRRGGCSNHLCHWL